eukprot:817747-Alexandrium_andersonii.AAC.1
MSRASGRNIAAPCIVPGPALSRSIVLVLLCVLVYYEAGLNRNADACRAVGAAARCDDLCFGTLQLETLALCIVS